MDNEVWMWVAIAAAVIIVIVVVAVIATRGKGEVRDRERAAELREKASQDEQLLTSRQERTQHLESQAEAARQRAMTESDRADSLRVQAGESDELAARASDKAEILDDEATHSREAFNEAIDERDEALREADRRDPDVKTDRHGNRIAETDPDEDVIVVPEEERLDIGDDYSGDVFAEPDAEYIDPVEHDRMAREDQLLLDERPDEVMEDSDSPAPMQARHMETGSSDDDLATYDRDSLDEATGPAVDPFGAPVAGTDTSHSSFGVDAAEDTEHRDDLGRRIDPYGNPVMEDDEFITSAPSHDDFPRDEQGRRLDPYGNPVADDRDPQ
ncbi:hypothetical protein [Tessaracoccus sp.]